MRSSPTTPFADPAEDLRLLELAKVGNLEALDHLVRRHQPWVFNLALRMVWRRETAEDATQEILLKAVTHLGSFAGRSKFSTWLYRIAVNHLLTVRKSEMEERSMTFTTMAQSLDDCGETELPDESLLPVGHGLLVEEAKLGCITAMLMCLDRRQRLAFILGEVFGVESEAGGEIMDISADHFRQLLNRARRDLYHFMQGKCGLVNALNPCRCSKKASGFMERGWLDPHRRQFTRERLGIIADVAPDRLHELQVLERAHARIYREAPFHDSADMASRLRAVLESSPFGRE